MKEISQKDELYQYFHIEKDRVFLDICVQGCGSRCAYCYVKTKDSPQVLLTKSQIDKILACIASCKCCNDMIVSLCPNTEPLRSDESMKMIIYICKFFLSRGSFVQISTKEYVPEWFLKELEKFDTSRLYINISVPFLSNHEAIEPGAATIENRLDVFYRIKKHPHINLCLYIKPYFKKDSEEQRQYIDLIKALKIKYVCVGVKFIDNTDEWPCASLYHSESAGSLIKEQWDEINHFSSELRQLTDAYVFYSSVCVINCAYHRKCNMQFFDRHTSVCKNCLARRES